jgi:hypothetical protein
MDVASFLSSPGGAASLGIAQSLLQNFQANKARKRAEADAPPLVDPNQAGFLAEIAAKRKSINTGAAFAEGMRNADTTGASTMDAITRSGGGNAAATMQGLLAAQKGTDIAKNNVLAQGQQQGMAYDNMYSHILDQISGRKLQLQLARQAQNMAQYAATKGSANANMSAGVAGLISKYLQDQQNKQYQQMDNQDDIPSFGNGLMGGASSVGGGGFNLGASAGLGEAASGLGDAAIFTAL